MPRAIDVHIHPFGPKGRPGPVNAIQRDYFRSSIDHRTVEEMAEYYEKLVILGVLVTIDDRTKTGRLPEASNDFIAELTRRYPKQFSGFGSVEPWMGKWAIDEAVRCVKELGLRGFKFHPSQQHFFPDDQQFYPLWAKISELDVPILLHSGTTGVGVGQPGGGGIKLKYCKPIPHIDDVAADFPAMNIILGHQAFPWVTEQLAVLVHKPNVYMDLSGWSPKYFEPQLIQYANTRVKHKVLFGSDYPLISPERWLSDFANAPFEDDVRPLILAENARRLLKLP